MASYSVLIKGGSILRGQKLEVLDVGIKDDKIAAIGDLGNAGADVVVEATGKYVSPGFVDLTSHSDTHWTIFSQPRQESLLTQGITTVLGGNCGASVAPLVKASDIEGIQKWANASEINTNWKSMGEFLEELSRHQLGVNFATLVGHGTLRRGILGDDSREMTQKEIDEAVFILKNAMDEGAFGLSTSLGAAHGKNTSREELSALFKVVADHQGLTKHHLKDEGKNILPAITEILSLGRESGARVQFSHFKLLGKQSWAILPEAINLIEFSGQEEKTNVTLDFFPYTKTGSQLYMLLPSWIIEGGRTKILSSLKDPKLRKEVLDYLKSLTLHYDRMVIASTLKDTTVIGKTIGELAASSGLDGEEIIAELVEMNQLHVSIFNEVISPDYLEDLIVKDYAMVASDGVGYNLKLRMPYDLPHPRSYGTFPLALELFARKNKVVPWGDILYKFSEFPAKVLGLKDRGRIEEGLFADLVVIDPEKVGSTTDYSAVHHEVEGIEWVFVNGKTAVKNGVLADAAAGRVIKRA